jgi:MerR family transcriptional regulator/heat shock protein HspR
VATSHLDPDEPCYVISVAAKMLGLNAQALRHYERSGLLEPNRSKGNIRLYSVREVERARRIKTLIEDMGVNLAGVEIILRLMDQIQEMEILQEQFREEFVRLRAPRLGKP